MRPFAIFYSILFWTCLAISGLFALVVICPVAISPLIIATFTIGIGLGAFVPRLGVALGLFLLPLVGNRPGTTQAVVCVFAGSALFLGITIRGFLQKRDSISSIRDDELKNPLIFTGLLFCLFSVASLLSIPLNHAFADLRNITSKESIESIASSLLSLARLPESSILYSFLSVYYTSLSFLLGFATYRMCGDKSAETARILIAAIFGGMILSITIGVLDYYGAIDLLWLRELDPVVNRKGKHFRLQSSFGHSGWYAEYLTLTIPMCLILLANQGRFWLRVASIIFTLAIGEFVLILTYQRGGWLSYPLTLCAVWSAIYVVRRLEKGQTDIIRAFRSSALKVAISLPLTLIASLLLVASFQKSAGLQEAISPYLSRFKDIQRTNDRTEFLKAGFLIGSLHPILGAGADSFAWQFDKEMDSPTGEFTGRFNLPLHGSAHNVYAQTFSGKGICGLFALVAIPILMIVAAFRTIPNHQRTILEKLVVLIGACFGTAFLIYGNVQEIFYVQALQFLFFCVLGIVAAVAFTLEDRTPRRALIPFWLCVALIAAHLVWELGAPGPTRAFYQEARPFGCFPKETTPAGLSYRWCGKRALIEKPIAPGERVIEVVLESGPLSETIELHDEGMPSVSVTLAPGEKRAIRLDVSDSAQARGVATIHLQASASFVPSLLWPASGDMRRLAIKVFN